MNIDTRRVIQTLKRVRKVLERGWARGAYAYNAEGNYVEPDSPKAVKWCMLGAFAKVDGPYQYRAEDAIEEVLGRSIVSYNDAPKRRKSDMLKLIDRTVKRLEKEGTGT